MKFIRRNGGFSLVEVLVVMLILGISVSAIYSLYLTHLKNAYTQDAALEVQQNLRMGMDTISRDLRMDGLFVPLSNSAIGAGPYGSYSTSITLNSASPTGQLVNIVQDEEIATPSATYTAVVNSKSGLFVGDFIRVIRPATSQPVFQSFSSLKISGLATYSAGPPALYSVSFQQSPTANVFPVGNDVKAGDVIVKDAYTTSGAYDTLSYYGVTGGDCPAGQMCLARSVNGSAPDIVAGNLTSIRFRYILTDGSESNNPTDVSSVRAVRVTLAGQASSGSGKRELTSVVYMRNKR